MIIPLNWFSSVRIISHILSYKLCLFQDSFKIVLLYRFVSGSQDISGWKENVLRDIEEEIQDFSLYNTHGSITLNVTSVMT